MPAHDTRLPHGRLQWQHVFALPAQAHSCKCVSLKPATHMPTQANMMRTFWAASRVDTGGKEMGLPKRHVFQHSDSHLPSCTEAELCFLVVPLPCLHALTNPQGTPPMQRAQGQGQVPGRQGSKRVTAQADLCWIPQPAHAWYLTPYCNQTARCKRPQEHAAAMLPCGPLPRMSTHRAAMPAQRGSF